jgi:peptide/nickel transport system permease protein
MATSAERLGTGLEFSDEFSGFGGEGEEDLPPGIGPWKLAWRRLRRNKVALFFGGLFVLIVLLCLLAPVYAADVAHTTPQAQNITGTIKVGGKAVDIVSPTDIPVGPTWHTQYFLGADDLGRDVAVRLLYGGRNSLQIGAVATILTMVFALILGLMAGYYRGAIDGVVSRALDVIWAYPAVLLGITLGTVLAVGGIGPIHGNNLWVPAFIIGIVYIPYVAKPIRGQVLQMREREFIDAARQQGLSNTRIMFSEIMPNLSSTILVFIPLILANAILLEAALSYLGVGVEPPAPSWGNMISDGISTIPAAFHNVLVPGIMLVLCVMSINIFGDGLRDALDPRAKVRIAH